ncbi:unnamed protein product [Rotaria sordida]|uniref:valine--tRNA ligase n=1 Tax=Rotaria sordida TaxID=392033 RepID=A0A813XMA3_9BILA|nr:unnamed protein product [Rotaria sordida]CAF3692299.1 unnamed protein product [Rotaria sordida]
MLGDTAVVVHPNDERYKDLHSKYVQHPFLQRRLPILTDTMVDPAFDSGAVKVTPAHDPNDLEYGRRLNLQFITCINNDGLMSSECEPYSGKPRFDVRHQLLNDLKERGLYRDSKENEMILLICSRSKDIIEPLLKSQWYVNCKDMAKRSIGAVQDKELKILPISFELVWYKCSDDIPVGNETDDHYWISAHTYEEALDKAAQRFNIAKDKIRLTQDEDVLDTWFSSSLLPFSSFGWPMETDDFKKFFFQQQLTGRLPFTEVYLHAIIRNADECKMSQTLGNVINPLDFIHDISLEKLQEGFKSSKEDYPDGQYVNLNKFCAEPSRDFCNDLFLTGTETPCDLWILSRLSYAIEQCESGFKKYQFSQITTAIYNFWLPELNDIYIEYVKKDFYADKPNLEQQNRQNTIKLILYTCLNNGLRLTAPIMPYLSEELYQRLPKSNNGQNSPPSLCITPYPQSSEFNQYHNKTIEKDVATITDAIDKINSHYSTPGVPRHEPVTLYIKSSSSISTLFKEYFELIKSLTNIDNIQILNDEPTVDQKEYIHIATTSDYRLFFKLTDDLE